MRPSMAPLACPCPACDTRACPRGHERCAYDARSRFSCDVSTRSPATTPDCARPCQVRTNRGISLAELLSSHTSRHARLYSQFSSRIRFDYGSRAPCARKLPATAKIGFIAVSIVSAPPSCTRACELDNSPAEILECQHKISKSVEVGSTLAPQSIHETRHAHVATQSAKGPRKLCFDVLHAALTRKHRSITACQSLAGMWVIRA